jgi:hypothetical protein
VTAAAVTSSMISRIAHDAQRLRLFVEFRGGTSHYVYDGVGPEAMRDLVNAESVGKHFIAHFRDSYTFAQLPPEEFESQYGRLGRKFEINWDRIVPLIEFA